ncbi:hypothetical protein DRW07_10880 [Alteromonas sediminis]|uniref:Uncharacterized protein n=1 Tax=Alteromonas sediminis TaxID=2259342 RepID=A0A3N5Y0G9_9ALTE|nr:hypothetical protein [Alteromonas sediminis]RPJ66580.1 hypothetical protein DRW07_10880 [Alteromonas sediminis]
MQKAINKQTATWAKILMQENPMLSAKIVSNVESINQHNVHHALTEVVRFLWLCAKHEHVLTPSVIVDNCWHEFILFTRTYAVFCSTTLGTFIHHQPSANEGDNQRQYLMTRELYQQTFGPMNQVFWPALEQVAACGTCED